MNRAQTQSSSYRGDCQLFTGGLSSADVSSTLSSPIGNSNSKLVQPSLTLSQPSLNLFSTFVQTFAQPCRCSVSLSLPMASTILPFASTQKSKTCCSFSMASTCQPFSVTTLPLAWIQKFQKLCAAFFQWLLCPWHRFKNPKVFTVTTTLWRPWVTLFQ